MIGGATLTVMVIVYFTGDVGAAILAFIVNWPWACEWGCRGRGSRA